MQLAVLVRNRNVRWAWAGQFLNVLGDATFTVAIAAYLLPRSDAPRALGLVLGLVSLGGLASLLFGGVLADRYLRTRVIIGSDLVRMAGLLGLIAVGPDAGLWRLGLAGLVLGVGTGIYRPAFGALLPSLVRPADLHAVNSLRALTNRLGVVLGAGLAGLLIGLASPRLVLWVDVATFLLSILTLLAVREPRFERLGGLSVAAEIAGGLRFVGRHRWMTAIMLQGTMQIAFVAAPVQVALPLAVGGSSGGQFGYVVAAEGLGAVAGAAAVGFIRGRRRGLVAMGALLLQVPQLVAIALGATFVAIVVVSVLAGLGLAVFAVLWISALQEQVPRDRLGRVLSLDTMSATAVAPVGLVATGWLISSFGVAAVAWVALAVLIVSVFVASAIPGVSTLSTAEHGDVDAL